MSARPHDVTESPHPQIDPEKHLKGECFKCHKPHHPDLKRPEEKTAADVEKETLAPATVEKEAVKPTRKAAPAVSEVGRKVYQDKCLVCHGQTGDGKTETAEFLTPKPPDFSSASYKSTLTQDSRFYPQRQGPADAGLREGIE